MEKLFLRAFEKQKEGKNTVRNMKRFRRLGWLTHEGL
jgi:hypothetical protein